MLTKSQQYAMKLLENKQNVFLTGEAGTGKSFVLQQFIEQQEKRKTNIVVCAPTGVAAVNVGGTTIHRLFRLSPVMMSPDDEISVSKLVARADCIVIDEISMCRGDLFYNAMRIIQKAEKSSHRHIQVVVVGDFYQLPPVLRSEDKEAYHKIWEKYVKEEYKKIPMAERFPFTLKIWDEMGFKMVCLKEVVRQDNKEFITALESARIGDVASLRWIMQHVPPVMQENAIYLAGLNRDVNERNRNELDKIPSHKYTFYAEATGKADPKDFLADEYLDLKIGCRVMLLTNDMEGAYVNGDMGEVVAIEESFMGDDPVVTVKLDKGITCEIRPYEWQMNSYRVEEESVPHVVTYRRFLNGVWTDIPPETNPLPYDNETLNEGEQVEYFKESHLVKEIIGTYVQLPLKLAYAITIHKSQGQTFDKVNLNPWCFDDGMLYVALSRVRDIKGLYISGYLSSKFLRCSEAVKKFYTEAHTAPIVSSEEVKVVPQRKVSKKKKKSHSFYMTEEEARFLKKCLKMFRESPEKLNEIVV